MALATPSQPGLPLGKISQFTFLALMWASAAVALPFVPLRFYVRRKIFHKLFVDDFLVMFAYLLLLAFAINWQIGAPAMYHFIEAGARLTPIDQSFIVSFDIFQKSQIIAVLLYGLCLWSIKLAFLLFFRRLGYRVHKQRIVWWSVLVVNILALGIWLGIIPWKCLTLPSRKVNTICSNKATADFGQLSLKLQAASDVVSDASIMIVPTTLLWNVQIDLRKKLMLGGIFSLTVLIIITSVIRVAGATPGGEWFDHTWMQPWTGVEMGVAVIVACLASFRALFTTNTASQHLPAHHQDHHNDPERHALAKFSFHNIGRFSTSIARTAAPCENTPFDQSLISSKAFIKAINGQQYEHAVEEDGYKMLSKKSGESLGSESDQIRVVRRVSVHTENSPARPEAVRYR